MKYFINQIGSKDCGYACLKMLMAIVYKRKDFLFYPIGDIDTSYSLKDLMGIAAKEGVSISAYRAQKKEDIFKKMVKAPFLIPVKSGDLLHMLLVRKVRRRKVYVFDPKNGAYWIKKEKLLDIWNGEILEATAHTGSDFNVKKTKLIPFKTQFFTIFSQIMSFLSLVVALYFINEEISFLVPLGFLLTYIILEFIFERILVSGMKNFDKQTLIPEFSSNRRNFKERYIKMNKFKSMIFANPVQFVGTAMISLFALVLLGINSYLNLIGFGIIFLFQIGFHFIFKYYFKYRRNGLEELEKELNASVYASKEEFNDKLKRLNEETYKYVSLSNSKKYLMTFLIFAISLFLMALSGNISINFMLFHFFIMVYLFENIEKLLNVSENLEEYNKYKALYLFYFNKY